MVEPGLEPGLALCPAGRGSGLWPQLPTRWLKWLFRHLGPAPNPPISVLTGLRAAPWQFPPLVGHQSTDGMGQKIGARMSVRAQIQGWG